MRRWVRFLSAAAGPTVLLTVVVYAASPEDGQAAFQRREDTMKHMGRPFYLGIGRVVKGTAAYGPDTAGRVLAYRNPVPCTGSKKAFFARRSKRRASGW